MLKQFQSLILLIACGFQAFGQTPDTGQVKELLPVVVEGVRLRNEYTRLEPVVGTYLLAGKKSESLSLTTMDAAITEKIGRQIFAKVPGVFVYDLEGSNQTNIAIRGLDPHRGWEFNLRKDGILINSDLYAYPASHYSIPFESVERIEMVRGTASLQYGAQFGGMINYISKQGDTSRPFGFESFTTIGSFNLLSTYHAVGGKVNKLQYYAYHAQRSRQGYRDNESTRYDAQGVTLTYHASDRLRLRADYARSSYLYRIPGPLTDAMFAENPRQATRSRNYYQPIIHVPSLTIDLSVTENTRLQWVSSAVLGERRSLLFDRPATIADTIVRATGQYNHRQVDIDYYRSFTHEFRLLQNYKVARQKATLATGLQWIDNIMRRNQLGRGTTGIDYDLSLVDPTWGRDLKLHTQNLAFFAENSLALSKNFTLNAGLRLENGQSDLSGQIVYYPSNEIPVTISRRFLLLGAGFSYTPFNQSEFYGSIGQNYRPILFKDLIPGSIFERVDPDLRDANGYNLEIGYRGSHKQLKWDITAFVLHYNNRFGLLALSDPGGDFFTWRTNIGDAITLGIEVFLQNTWNLTTKTQLTLFTATSLMEGLYTSGNLKRGNENVPLKGNQMENVPRWITRNGITHQWRGASLTFLVSHVSNTFADPFNTLAPNATGTVGLVPGYTLLDINGSLRLLRNLEIRASLNNVANKQYFTKRPLFYPGPGVWPSDGRNGQVSVVFRI